MKKALFILVFVTLVFLTNCNIKNNKSEMADYQSKIELSDTISAINEKLFLIVEEYLLMYQRRNIPHDGVEMIFLIFRDSLLRVYSSIYHFPVLLNDKLEEDSNTIMIGAYPWKDKIIVVFDDIENSFSTLYNSTFFDLDLAINMQHGENIYVPGNFDGPSLWYEITYDSINNIDNKQVLNFSLIDIYTPYCKDCFK